jgi:hypothetical protein
MRENKQVVCFYLNEQSIPVYQSFDALFRNLIKKGYYLALINGIRKCEEVNSVERDMKEWVKRKHLDERILFIDLPSGKFAANKVNKYLSSIKVSDSEAIIKQVTNPKIKCQLLQTILAIKEVKEHFGVKDFKDIIYVTRDENLDKLFKKYKLDELIALSYLITTKPSEYNKLKEDLNIIANNLLINYIKKEERSGIRLAKRKSLLEVIKVFPLSKDGKVISQGSSSMAGSESTVGTPEMEQGSLAIADKKRARNRGENKDSKEANKGPQRVRKVAKGRYNNANQKQSKGNMMKRTEQSPQARQNNLLPNQGASQPPRPSVPMPSAGNSPSVGPIRSTAYILPATFAGPNAQAETLRGSYTQLGSGAYTGMSSMPMHHMPSQDMQRYTPLEVELMGYQAKFEEILQAKANLISMIVNSSPKDLMYQYNCGLFNFLQQEEVKYRKVISKVQLLIKQQTSQQPQLLPRLPSLQSEIRGEKRGLEEDSVSRQTAEKPDTNDDKEAEPEKERALKRIRRDKKEDLTKRKPLGSKEAIGLTDGEKPSENQRPLNGREVNYAISLLLGRQDGGAEWMLPVVIDENNEKKSYDDWLKIVTVKDQQQAEKSEVESREDKSPKVGSHVQQQTSQRTNAQNSRSRG